MLSEGTSRLRLRLVDRAWTVGGLPLRKAVTEAPDVQPVAPKELRGLVGEHIQERRKSAL